MGLRWLNGHALKNEADKTQRLIVEFAIENAQVVTRRKAAEEKARTRTREGPALKGPNRSTGRTSLERKGGVSKRGKKSKAGQTEPQRAGKPSKDADPKLALQQTIIARKRSIRKKKAKARQGK